MSACESFENQFGGIRVSVTTYSKKQVFYDQSLELPALKSVSVSERMHVNLDQVY